VLEKCGMSLTCAISYIISCFNFAATVTSVTAHVKRYFSKQITPKIFIIAKLLPFMSFASSYFSKIRQLSALSITRHFILPKSSLEFADV
jgi:hypothetical protein